MHLEIEWEKEKILSKLEEAYTKEDQHSKVDRDYDTEVLNQIIALKKKIEDEEIKKLPLKKQKTIKKIIKEDPGR